MSSNPSSIASDCPISRCAELVCGKWTLLVIRDLLAGPKYFGELEQSLAGISPRTLCERLKFLAERGIVTRTYIKALPPRTQYELTTLGHSLSPLLDAMRDIGTEFLSHPLAADPAATTADGCGCGDAGQATDEHACTCAS